MGKFDGILLLSDIDGTLTYKEGHISEKNLEKIAYFKSEGGTFSIATGRDPGFLARHGLDKLLNAPAVILNGAAIYDYTAGKMFSRESITEDLSPVLDYIKENCKGCRVSLSGNIKEVYYAPGVPDSDPFEALYHAGACDKLAIASLDEAFSIRLQQSMEKDFPQYDIHRGWSTGVEVISKKAGKGNGLLRLKKLLGNIHTTAAIGDFENDLSMLRAADVSACPENAVPELKACADMIVASNTQNAVADFIDKLQLFIKGTKTQI